MCDACTREQVPPATGDVVIVTSKIVSKAEGRVLSLRDITPSGRARAIAKTTGKDPVEVEISCENRRRPGRSSQ